MSETAMKGGWGHKTGIKLSIYHPINLHGGDFRFVKLFNQGKELLQLDFKIKIIYVRLSSKYVNNFDLIKSLIIFNISLLDV